MDSITIRIKKRIRLTLDKWKSDVQFSKKYAMLRIMDDFSGRLGMSGISNWAHKKKEQWALAYLEKMLKPVIQKYRDESNAGVMSEEALIWICWWTGIETAPVLVQKCVASIYKNAGRHPVNLITKDTYQNYISIPDFLFKRLRNQEIGLAHFADYIRVCLLEKYGGLWLDATMYCASQIPESYFEYPVFTCKSPYIESRYLSNYQWVTFCLGGWAGNTFYSFLREAFEQYWQQEKTAIDYLFFDYLIYIARNQVPYIADVLKAVPNNNLRRDDLQRAMNEAAPADRFRNVINTDTIFYKLSWREKYTDNTTNHEESIYHYFINQ